MIATRAAAAAVLLAACLTTGGCSGSGEPLGVPVKEEATPFVAGSASTLATARAQWRAAGITRYRFTEGRACFCGGRGAVRLDVVRDPTPPFPESVRSLTYEEEPGTPVQYPEAYLTVEQLFDVIEKSLADGTEIVVSYHAGLGYPTKVDIQPSLHPVDGGVLYGVTKFEIVERR